MIMAGQQPNDNIRTGTLKTLSDGLWTAVASEPLCQNYFGIKRSTLRISDDEHQNPSTREKARMPHNACATCGKPLFSISTAELVWIWFGHCVSMQQADMIS